MLVKIKIGGKLYSVKLIEQFSQGPGITMCKVLVPVDDPSEVM
jgi:hypothetical protein